MVPYNQNIEIPKYLKVLKIRARCCVVGKFCSLFKQVAYKMQVSSFILRVL
jgi:hypothetical protein